MKMTRREFLVWLGGTVCLGLLGWLVGRKLQVLPEPVPEAPFEPPMFAVRQKHTNNRRASFLMTVSISLVFVIFECKGTLFSIATHKNPATNFTQP